MPADERMSAWAIFAIFTRLGLTSFGGPVAHIAYFKTEFVDRRRWFADAEYADIIALCQLMPGPASSQVGLAIGLSKGGYRGMLAAWCGFTWPSALLMTAFGLGLVGLGGLGDDPGGAGWLHGLMIVVVAVVAQAVLTMARGICTTPAHGVIALAAAAVALLAPGTLTQMAAILVGAVLGSVLMSGKPGSPGETVTISAVPVSRGVARVALFSFFLILAALPLLRMGSGDPTIALADTVYRAGALVFGGGHVVLPLLEAGVVDTGWVAARAFSRGLWCRPGPAGAAVHLRGLSRCREDLGANRPFRRGRGIDRDFRLVFSSRRRSSALLAAIAGCTTRESGHRRRRRGRGRYSHRRPVGSGDHQGDRWPGRCHIRRCGLRGAAFR